jgi:hypothetical protein
VRIIPNTQTRRVGKLHSLFTLQKVVINCHLDLNGCLQNCYHDQYTSFTFRPLPSRPTWNMEIRPYLCSQHHALKACRGHAVKHPLINLRSNRASFRLSLNPMTCSCVTEICNMSSQPLPLLITSFSCSGSYTNSTQSAWTLYTGYCAVLLYVVTMMAGHLPSIVLRHTHRLTQ